MFQYCTVYEKDGVVKRWSYGKTVSDLPPTPYDEQIREEMLLRVGARPDSIKTVMTWADEPSEAK